jgi:hypothetical protein
VVAKGSAPAARLRWGSSGAAPTGARRAGSGMRNQCCLGLGRAGRPVQLCRVRPRGQKGIKQGNTRGQGTEEGGDAGCQDTGRSGGGYTQGLNVQTEGGCGGWRQPRVFAGTCLREPHGGWWGLAFGSRPRARVLQEAVQDGGPAPALAHPAAAPRNGSCGGCGARGQGWVEGAGDARAGAGWASAPCKAGEAWCRRAQSLVGLGGRPMGIHTVHLGNVCPE